MPRRGETPATENGQMAIPVLLVMTVTFVVGALAVDLGFWLSQRRGAQTAADFAVLAGAQALLDDASDQDGAFTLAVDFATRNHVDGTEIDPTRTSNCSAGNSCINTGTGNCREDGSDSAMPWVEAKIRRPSPSLFSAIFDVVAPDIGAVARACVGSSHTSTDLSPFGVQTGFNTAVGDPETGDQCLNDEDDDGDGEENDGCPLSDCLEPDPADPTRTRPVYGSVCILKTGAQDSVGGQRGQLTIGTADCRQTSSNTLKHDFHYGTSSACAIGQDVNTGSGNIIGLLQGLNDRLLEEGTCDAGFFTGNPGYDDFDEALSLVGGDPGEPIMPSPDNVFSANGCYVTSGQGGVPADPAGHTHTYLPRVVDLVLIDQLEQGEQNATITGFAAFYVIGCFKDAVALQTKQDIEQDLTDFDSFMNRCDSPTGQDDILGIFVKSLQPPANVGDPDENLPLSIVLVK